jgi:ELWxxDGT repeat protein
LVAPLSGVTQPGSGIDFNGKCVFTAQASNNATQLWISDGTAAGTVQIGAYSGMSNLTVASNRLFFYNEAVIGATNYDQIWQSDGTAAGTQLVMQVPDTFESGRSIIGPSLQSLGGNLFFLTIDGHTGDNQNFTLWKADGVTAPVPVQQFPQWNGGPAECEDFVWNGALYWGQFGADDSITLWQSDGTVAGTAPLTVLPQTNPAPPAGTTSHILQIWGTGSSPLFLYDEISNQFWSSDGTAAGTQEAGVFSQSLQQLGGLQVVGSETYFSEFTGPLVATPDIIAGGLQPDPLSYNRELWVSDGTAAGTREVATLPGMGGSAGEMANANGLVYFAAGDPAHGVELWQSDGTAAGTMLADDLLPGAASSNPYSMTVVDGSLYFSAASSSNSYTDSLWVLGATQASAPQASDVHVPAYGVVAPNGTFYLQNANSTGGGTLVLGFGSANWIPIAGDWDGNGSQTVGMYNPATSTFYLRNSNTKGNADVTFGFGQPGAGWLPIVGDWTGSGTDTVGLYDPNTSTFYLRNSNTAGVANLTFGYGARGANLIPVSGNWNGGSQTTVGLYDPATSVFELRNSNDSGIANITFGFGTPGSSEIPIAGYFGSQSNETVGLYDPKTSTFYLRNSNTTGVANQTFGYGTPGAGWRPVVGNWSVVTPGSDIALAPALASPVAIAMSTPNVASSSNLSQQPAVQAANRVDPLAMVSGELGSEPDLGAPADSAASFGDGQLPLGVASSPMANDAVLSATNVW